MLKTIVATLAILAFALAGSAVMAGDWHTGTTLICSDCHTMHYSESHDFAGGAAPTLGAGGPHGKLLKASPNDLCLICHDGQSFAPDVSGGHTNGYVREAGGLADGSAGYESWKGHSLGSTAIPPGGTWTPSATEGLMCIDCHSMHGSSTQWRNLQSKPGGVAVSAPVLYAKTTNDTSKDIFERNPAAGQISTHYAVSNVELNKPSLTSSATGQWCAGCHTNFHGTAASANMNDGTDWLRHPTANAVIGSGYLVHSTAASSWGAAGRTNYVHVMDPSGNFTYETGADVGITDANLIAKGYTPTCLSCHKAHGNQNAFALIQMDRTGTVTEEGTSNGANNTARMLCRQCHTQGS